MKRVASFFRGLARQAADAQTRAASASMVEELFYDLYKDRKKVYKINFFRGIFFGVGSALGGTIVLAVVVWILSLFVNFPVIGDTFQDAQNTIEQRTNSTEPRR